MKKITKKIPVAKPVKKNNSDKISGETTLRKILDKKGGEKVLHKNGVPCMSCPMASFEIDKLKIGEVCKSYGLNLKKILQELNS